MYEKITQSTSDADYLLIYKAESPSSKEKHYLLLKQLYVFFQDRTDTLRTVVGSVPGRFLNEK